MRVRELTTRPAAFSILELFSRIIRRPAEVVRIERRQTPYWTERGWVQNGREYLGAYQTPYGAFCGKVIQRGAGQLRFYIQDPPEELKRHSHWTCFVNRGGNTYEVHMGRMPADASSGIMTIERLLVEAIKA